MFIYEQSHTDREVTALCRTTRGSVSCRVCNVTETHQSKRNKTGFDFLYLPSLLFMAPRLLL